MPSARAFPIDPFIIGLICAAALGFLLPASGAAVPAVSYITKASIALLFFLQGVRLQRAAIVAGLTHWRLQFLTLACTFALFPLLGLALHGSARGLLDSSLWVGVLYLCTLPSTVQSSIAFTSIAKGNVAAAICAATASNLLGIVITPLLVAAMLNLHGTASPLEQIQSIVLQLFVPFVLGQIVSRWLRPWATRHAKVLTISDRGSILLVVYSAFSAAVHAGAWSDLSWEDIAKILGICALLLAIALLFTRFISRTVKFSRQDEIAVVFCGSKKSLATGVPMANILFPAATVGLVILPVMVYHQIQLMVCAALARRYAEKAATTTETGPPTT